MKRFAVLIVVLALWPMVATAQQQPLPMPGGSQYGIRIPSKLPGCYAPVASNLIGSDEDHHTRRGSPTLAYDWSASVGSPVFSICPGKVRTTSNNNRGGYGSYVIIDHGSGLSTLYAHCIANSFTVKPGQDVTAWTQICSVGLTGMTSWPHVHLNIDNNGTHTRVGQYFDQSLVRICHFSQCKANNPPNAPVYRDGSVVAAEQSQQRQSATNGATVTTTVVQTRLAKLLEILRTVKPELVSMLVVGFLGLLVLIWWLGGMLERIFVVSLGTSVIVVAAGLWLVMPLQTTVQAQAQPMQTGQQAVVSGSVTWKAAYAFMRRWEGAKCVHDPVRTFKGVTNGTYNAWRQSKGMGPGDVCRDLTEQQAEAIYYERYWVASGAGRLSPAVAIAHFDHAVNAGVGAAKGVLAQCGDNIDCYIKGRLADYRTKKNCPQYCRAWQNRVNDLVKFLQKGQ